MFASKVHKAHVSFRRVYRRKHQAFKITRSFVCPIPDMRWHAWGLRRRTLYGRWWGEFEDIYRPPPFCILFWKQPLGERINADHPGKEVHRTFLRHAAKSLNVLSFKFWHPKHSRQSTRQQSNLVLWNCHHQILHCSTTQLIRLLRWR